MPSLESILLAWTLLSSPAADWTQWGGPNRNFSVADHGLADHWPAAGPRKIWQRPLGEGYSAILAEGGRLYTMRRAGERDVVVCLDAATGETLWETDYPAPIAPDMDVELGPGPISTPLLAGERLFTVGATVKLHCLDKRSGAVLWRRDLREELGASHLGRGYGASPVAYRDLVILPLGGEERAVVAFHQETGEVAWRALGFDAGYASPILARVAGEEQLVVALGSERAGLDPATGEVRWRHGLPASAEAIMSTPHWGEDQVLLTSVAYGDGTRAIRVDAEDGAFTARELWYSRHMRVMFGAVVRIGDFVYGSSGDFGPAFLVAIDVRDGRVAWRERGFARAHLLRAGDRVLILDEEGELALASLSPEGAAIHARAKVIERLIWTPPTLAGTRLYLRNRTTIEALDLAAGGSAGGADRCENTDRTEEAGHADR